MSRAYFILPTLLIGILVFNFCTYSANTAKKSQRDYSVSTQNPKSKEDSIEVKLVDHHIHIFSSRDRQYLINRIEGLDSLPPLGIKQYLKVMKNGKVKKAAILSNAYFFSDKGKTSKKEFSAVQSDNNRIVRIVSQYPEKFVGFISVNPLSDSALKVIKRNSTKEEFIGLKLQLANSKVNLRKESHVRRLAQVFETANSLGLPIVVHMRYQEKPYGKKDAQIFIDKVLSQAPDIPIQIAHLAGWGGYDPETDKVLSVFAKRISNKNLRDNIYFDISAVIRPVGNIQEDSTETYSKNPEWYPENRDRRLTKRLRKIGLNRILFGTDWPEWTPADYKSDIIKKLYLTKKELRTLFSNRAPWFN